MTGLLLAAGLLAAWLGLPTAGTAARWVDLVLIGCNDDWASKASNLAELLKHGPDVIFIQEGKAAHYRNLRVDPHDPHSSRLLPYDTWGVHQDTSSPARAGSVVIWRHDKTRATGMGFAYGTKAAGTLTRWIAWVRAVIGGTRMFLFSAHYPPQRVRAWWKPFGLHLWARVRLALAAGRLVIGQMDSNQHGGPAGIPNGLHWVAVHGSIDGFVLSRRIRVVGHVEELPKHTSDHHPILLHVRVPTGPHNRRKKAA